ncbi:hypothetical protein [Haladaptatus sp. DJG-WS-42]|uniref:hypothetical protein n=1 Tax=Haladaptatus sp. DJG-WS-42 TaxID=3120516 RepID=UPI0030CEF619
MSNSPVAEELAVSLEDVTVTKSYQAEKFPVPAIEFVVESKRDADALVRIIDYPPENIPKDDLGFHPEFGASHWTVAEDHIVFERTVAAGESYTTVYGIRDVDDEGIEAFLTEPELVVVDASADVEAVLGEDNNQVVREVLAGTTETLPGADTADTDHEEIEIPDPEPADEEDEIEPLELEDPDPAPTAVEEQADAEHPAGADEPVEPVAEPAESDAEDEAEQETEAESRGPSIMPGNVAAALAAEVREGRVSSDALDVLREELTEEAHDDSNDVRVKHIQAQVADLTAYTSALEEFIDENGPGRHLLDNLKSELANINDDLHDLNQRVASNDKSIRTLEDDSLELRDNINELDEQAATVRGNLGALEDDVLEVRGDVDDIEGDVSRLDETIDDVVAEQEEQLAELTEKQKRRLDEVQATQAELEATVAEMKQWRDQLAGVFGGSSE